MSYYSDPDGQLTLLELSGPGDAPIPPRRRPRPKPEADLIALLGNLLPLSGGKAAPQHRACSQEADPDVSIGNTGGTSG